MTDVLIRRDCDTDMQRKDTWRRRPPISQGERPQKKSALGHLDLRLSASRTEKMNFCLSHPVCVSALEAQGNQYKYPKYIELTFHVFRLNSCEAALPKFCLQEVLRFQVTKLAWNGLLAIHLLFLSVFDFKDQRWKKATVVQNSFPFTILGSEGHTRVRLPAFRLQSQAHLGGQGVQDSQEVPLVQQAPNVQVRQGALFRLSCPCHLAILDLP